MDVSEDAAAALRRLDVKFEAEIKKDLKDWEESGAFG
jgi:hypothetical protein